MSSEYESIVTNYCAVISEKQPQFSGVEGEVEE